MSYFSIIMPTFNQAEFIRVALNSILDQSEHDLELLVYDALSTDGTAEILEQYRDRLTWIREKDRGMTDAINKGFRSARGEVVAWLNSDDAYFPETLKRVREAFEADPGLDFVYGDAVEMNREGAFITPNLFTEDLVVSRYLHSHNYICQPTIFVRRRVLEKVGLLREDLRWTMDYEWFARIMIAGCKGRRLPYFLAANRDYATTLTNSGGWRRYREMLSIHRIRPGRPLILRKSFWIYSLEAFIKFVQGATGVRHASGEARRPARHVMSSVGELFLKMVAPADTPGIISRYTGNPDLYNQNVQAVWGKMTMEAP
jgi:glycosyltransferase involved in cell wall biosynthesis